MSWVAAAIGGSAILGLIGSNQASKAQTSAANQSNATQWNMYNQTRADQEPWRQAGVTALGQLGTGTADGGRFNRSFSMSDFTQDPGYQFRLQEGQKALERAGAAKGMTLSGAQSKALQSYGQGMASQEYGNAYNRWNQDQSTQFNRLASMAGLGQTANAANQASGTNAANNIGQNQLATGNANAAGWIGGTNAVTNGVNQYLNYNNMNNMWNSLNNSNGIPTITPN